MESAAHLRSISSASARPVSAVYSWRDPRFIIGTMLIIAADLMVAGLFWYLLGFYVALGFVVVSAAIAAFIRGLDMLMDYAADAKTQKKTPKG